MIREYIQSEEKYKGFVLRVRRFKLDDDSLMYHKQCVISINDQDVGISKTKKEAKELIDGNYIKRR